MHKKPEIATFGSITLVKRNWIIVAILVFALVLRVIAAVLISDQSYLLVDAVAYRGSAANLLQHWHTLNPYQMPLYPLLIAVTGAGIGQLAADITLSVISVWLVCALTEELFADRRATIFAGIAAACYPPLIYFSVVGLSEPLFVTLILVAFLCWYRANFTAAAIAAVLAILTRPIFDLFAPVLVLFFALVIHRFSLTQALRRLANYAGIYCCLMTPWWLSNYQAYGSFVRLTPGAGTVLYAGNNPLNHTGGGVQGDYDVHAFSEIADPVERDRALRNAAFTYIVDNPQRFLELAGLKFIRMWRLWPANEGYKNFATIFIAIASFAPALVLAGMGLFLRRRMSRRLSPILLFGLGYTGLIMIFVGTIRYRLPLEPFLIIFAGAAASYLSQTVPAVVAQYRFAVKRQQNFQLLKTGRSENKEAANCDGLDPASRVARL